MIGEHYSSTLKVGCFRHHLLKTVAKEDVVTQDESARISVHKFSSYVESLSQSTRVWLDGVGDGNAPLRTISQTRLERDLIVGGRDN